MVTGEEGVSEPGPQGTGARQGVDLIAKHKYNHLAEGSGHQHEQDG
ncbi:hypothetical protein [Meiothermus taiwanensis]|nr:hypothetical protein [Meiothermus taiwanensis]